MVEFCKKENPFSVDKYYKSFSNNLPIKKPSQEIRKEEQIATIQEELKLRACSFSDYFTKITHQVMEPYASNDQVFNFTVDDEDDGVTASNLLSSQADLIAHTIASRSGAKKSLKAKANQATKTAKKPYNGWSIIHDTNLKIKNFKN